MLHSEEIADAVSVINVKVILETGEVFYVRWKKSNWCAESSNVKITTVTYCVWEEEVWVLQLYALIDTADF